MWYERSFSYQKKAKNPRISVLWCGELSLTRLAQRYETWRACRRIYTFQLRSYRSIKDGENSVVVEVDNTRRLEGVPSIHTDWWNYGGITRGVKLIEVPDTVH